MFLIKFVGTLNIVHLEFRIFCKKTEHKSGISRQREEAN